MKRRLSKPRLRRPTSERLKVERLHISRFETCWGRFAKTWQNGRGGSIGLRVKMNHFKQVKNKFGSIGLWVRLG